MSVPASREQVTELAKVLYACDFHAADTWETDTAIRRGHYEGYAEAVLAAGWAKFTPMHAHPVPATTCAVLHFDGAGNPINCPGHEPRIRAGITGGSDD